MDKPSEKLADDILSKQKNKSVNHRLSAMLQNTFIIDSLCSEEGLYGGKITDSMDNMRREIQMIKESLGLAQSEALLDELTTLLDEHPDGWEGQCMCKECLQAGS